MSVGPLFTARFTLPRNIHLEMVLILKNQNYEYFEVKHNRSLRDRPKFTRNDLKTRSDDKGILSTARKEHNRFYILFIQTNDNLDSQESISSVQTLS